MCFLLRAGRSLSLHVGSSIGSQNSAATAKCSTRSFFSVLFTQWTAMTKLLNNFLHMLADDTVHHHSRALFLLLSCWFDDAVASVWRCQARGIHLFYSPRRLLLPKPTPYVILHYQQSGRVKANQMAHTKAQPTNQHIALSWGKIILLHPRFSQ